MTEIDDKDRDPAAAVSETGPANAGSGTRLVLVRCPLCGSDDYKVRYDDRSAGDHLDPQVHYTSTSSAFGSHGRIVECRSCSLLFVNPRPHHLKVQDSYAEVEDTRYLEEEQGRVETFAASVRHIQRFRASGRLLDVGSHVGTFLVQAQKAGYRVDGVEPSVWASGIASERIDGTIWNSAIEDAGLPEETYDVATIWDVIEHLPDPALTMRSVYSALKPGGIFAVSTMDVSAPFARLMGHRWPWYMHMHLVYFSRQTLTEMLRREGFEIVEVTKHTRRVRLSYLASRLTPYSAPAGRLAMGILSRLGLSERTVGINLGDIMTVIARRPQHADR
jgi:2-polyprenyl-3-methyl-5-hydroxy-6-metoxy-1,4-benzoquinol methylase